MSKTTKDLFAIYVKCAYKDERPNANITITQKALDDLVFDSEFEAESYVLSYYENSIKPLKPLDGVLVYSSSIIESFFKSSDQNFFILEYEIITLDCYLDRVENSSFTYGYEQYYR